MPEEKLLQIADDANMIIKGYAFTKDGTFIRIFNLNDGKSAMVISPAYGVRPHYEKCNNLICNHRFVFPNKYILTQIPLKDII